MAGPRSPCLRSDTNGEHFGVVEFHSPEEHSTAAQECQDRSMVQVSPDNTSPSFVVRLRRRRRPMVLGASSGTMVQPVPEVAAPIGSDSSLNLHPAAAPTTEGLTAMLPSEGGTTARPSAALAPETAERNCCGADGRLWATASALVASAAGAVDVN